MSGLVASLPMYDWPEVRAEVDAQWATIRDRLRERGFDAPEALTRGGDLHEIWRLPNLLLAQTCWGPMHTTGLEQDVRLVGQPDYSDVEGGQGPLYSSVIIMRRHATGNVSAPADGRADMPLDQLRDRRFTFNSQDSMSGILALTGDLQAAGESLEIFGDRIESGAHRASIIAVAEGKADVATIDCRSWQMARKFEPAAADVCVVGWTARRKGLPLIASATLPEPAFAALRSVLRDVRMIVD